MPYKAASCTYHQPTSIDYLPQLLQKINQECRDGLHTTGSDCTQLGQNAYDWVRMHMTGPECTWLGQNAHNWVRMHMIGSDCTQLGQTVHDWVKLYVCNWTREQGQGTWWCPSSFSMGLGQPVQCWLTYVRLHHLARDCSNLTALFGKGLFSQSLTALFGKGLFSQSLIASFGKGLFS